VSWWVPVLELALVAAAAAYLLGVMAARLLGSTVASFVGLTEVLFAVLWAWLLLGELPRPVQLGGGALIVAGVAAVRVGELRRERAAAAAAAAAGPTGSDFPLPAAVA
jgi:drug/metabolite transporter (DMT)-like permease